MRPTQARALLDAHGLAPRKADGQNFLVDPNTVRRIVDGADLASNDHVIEIGPGLGAMTALLVDEVAAVTAIELDAGLADLVTDTLGHRPELTVMHADAMDVDMDGLHRPGLPLRLVSNLPYNVATPLIVHVFSGVRVQDAWVMVQREVADRWTASPGDEAHGGVSVKLGLVVDATIEMTIPRSVFWPVPHVDSVMVRMRRRPDALAAEARARISTVVDAAFRQRRKTLRNNLRRNWPSATADALSTAGIDGARRAETLDVDEFIMLTRALAATGAAILPGR